MQEQVALPGRPWGATPLERGVELGARRQGVPFAELAGMGGRDVPEELRDQPTRRDRRILDRRAVELALRELLGDFARDAVALRELGGEVLVARDRGGRALRWSFWSPRERVLVDRFRRGWPAGGSDGPEMEDRAAFAREHGIGYAAVGPGQAMRVKDVRAWLAQRAAERGG